MSSSYPFIDEEGDVTVHREGSGSATYEFVDSDGVPRDVTASTVTFKTAGFEKPMTPGENANEKVLLLLGSELPPQNGKRSSFAIVETVDGVPRVLYEGNLNVREL